MHVRGHLESTHERVGSRPRHASAAHTRERTSNHGRTCGYRKDLARQGGLADWHGSTARLAEDELDRDSV